MPVRRLTAPEIAAFVRDELLSPGRTRPVVAITTNPHYPAATLNADRLASDLGGAADVVALETGDATWALTAALPSRLDVYGGAVRIWWPGLTATSKPTDHPLLFVWGPDDVARTQTRLVATVLARAGARRSATETANRGGLGAPATSPAPPAASTPSRPGGGVHEGVVQRVDGSRIEVLVRDEPGIVVEADLPLAEFAARTAPGVSLRLRPTAARGHEWSACGCLPAPWRRLREVYKEGDIVRARVCWVGDEYLLVEVLPGAVLAVPKFELDYGPVRHPAEFVGLGQRVQVRILTLDVTQRGRASIKQAHGRTVLPAPDLGDGYPQFLDGEPAPASPPPAPTDTAGLEDELRLAQESRREQARQIAELRKRIRSLEDRLQHHAAGEVEPLASEPAFLTAVRVAYARSFDEGSRASHPLQRMRVGREFLAHLRSLEGVDAEKVVEVCAQVACGRAHEIPGRSVHELHAGDRAGAAGRTRASDGAKAWRCSLQDGTPGARRLHWWEIPGRDGRTIEFASVAHHDDVSIPS